MLFEGMTIGGYAIGGDEGLLYLRGEYAYLRAYLEDLLRQRRDAGLLGKDICGKKGFHFDIRIQMGAGAYICGEETALLSSCEGDRGDPKTRPPFPAQKGYLGKPTTVNNVETFAKVARILEKGAPLVRPDRVGRLDRHEAAEHLRRLCQAPASTRCPSASRSRKSFRSVRPRTPRPSRSAGPAAE